MNITFIRAALKDEDNLGGIVIFQRVYEILSHKPITQIKSVSNLINWNKFSTVGLSEEIIDAFPDLVNWKNISKSSVLSESFIISHEDKIFFKELHYSMLHYGNFSKEFFLKYFDKLDPYNIYSKYLDFEVLDKLSILYGGVLECAIGYGNISFNEFIPLLNKVSDEYGCQYMALNQYLRCSKNITEEQIMILLKHPCMNNKSVHWVANNTKHPQAMERIRKVAKELHIRVL